MRVPGVTRTALFSHRVGNCAPLWFVCFSSAGINLTLGPDYVSYMPVAAR